LWILQIVAAIVLAVFLFKAINLIFGQI
jgi:hypothetical protein